MITNTAQSWTIGATVKVGFLQLRVTAIRIDGVYELENMKGDKFYDFTPHRGLVRVD